MNNDDKIVEWMKIYDQDLSIMNLFLFFINMEFWKFYIIITIFNFIFIFMVFWYENIEFI